MAPTTQDKPKQFSFIMSEEEHQMLQELAEAEGRSAAGWLRRAIRSAHSSTRLGALRRSIAAKQQKR